MWGDYPGYKLKQGDPLMSAGAAASFGMWSLVHAMRVRFTG
jgi:hypothetical protein